MIKITGESGRRTPPPPYNQLDLDVWAAQGCANPECREHDHTVYLHSRCHIDVPLMVVWMEAGKQQKNAAVLCIKCGTPLAVLATEKVEQEPPTKDCCKEEIYWANYTKGTGVVHFTCYFCKTEVMRVTVSK